MKRFGPVDILVNNAAVSYFLPIKDLTVKQWDISWAVGPRGMFVLSHEVLPEMIKRKSGCHHQHIFKRGYRTGAWAVQRVSPRTRRLSLRHEEAAMERFTQGLAQEVYQYGISVTCLSPSQLVPTPGTVYFKMATSMNDPRGESPEMMARACLLLASEPLAKVTGRVTYSQRIFKEFGWIKNGKGVGIDTPGSGFSKI